MEYESLPGKVHLEGLEQNSESEYDENGQQDAVQHKGNRLEP